MPAGSPKTSGSTSSSSEFHIPITDCQEFMNLIVPDGLTLKFSGAGSCLDGVEVEIEVEEVSPGHWGFVPVWMPLGCNAAAGVWIEFLGPCGRHNPPCCLHVVQPGHVEVVSVRILVTDAGKTPLFNESMRGCQATTAGCPYRFDMCTDAGGGGAPVQHVDSCLCLKGTSGLEVRVLP